MSSTITKVLAVRVKNETYDFFKGKPLNKIIENIHRMYKKDEVVITSDGDVFIPSGYDKRKSTRV